MKKIFCYLVMIVLSACTLEENIKKEEGKDYTDVVHPVDMVDYEFEQRLNSFYESEPIQNEELYGLYKGEFPEDERNPTKLRIHWRDARELALAELELQRPIQAGWEEADISVRPILVLDRDGGDFYRYYEYRVVKNMRFLGAIRIPAYRRTENFATAEVHRYSDDEKTYTIHVTGWGQYMAENSSLDINSSFIQNIEYSSNINKNFIYTIILNYLSEQYETTTRSLPQVPNHIAQESMNSMIEAFEKNNEAIQELESRHKGGELPSSIHNKAKDYYKRENIDQYKEGIKKYAQVMGKYDTLIKIMNDPELDSNNKLNLDQMFVSIYEEFIKGYIQKMSISEQKDVITEILKEFYWMKIEQLSYNKDKILTQKYAIDHIVAQYNISPYVVSKEFQKTEFLREENIIELLLSVIPQKIGFTIDNQNYTIITFIPPTENKRNTDRDQALDFLQDNLDTIGNNINNAIDKNNSVEIEQGLDNIKDLVETIIADGLTPGEGEANVVAKWVADLFVNDPFWNSVIDYVARGAISAALKNIDLIESFANNILPIVSGCIKLKTVNTYLQKNGIEKISEQDGKDIWFLERMCAVLSEISVQDLKDFDKKKPIESLVKLIGPILKVYMDSIYYAMSRSCDRWNIPVTYVGLENVLKDTTIYKEKDINGEIILKISVWDVYPVNMEWYLGGLHHAWWKKKFRPIDASFIATRGAFCYWRYAHPKKRYSWSTYTDW